MNTITPEMVCEAFAKTNLKPIRWDWHKAVDPNAPDDPRLCGCALTALLGASGYPIDLMTSITIVTYAEDQLGCGPLYTRGFHCGWDGAVKLPSGSDYDRYERFRMGYDDGARAWEAMTT